MSRSIDVTGRGGRLQPSAGLDPEVKTIFRVVVASTTPDHFRESDRLTLEAFCEAESRRRRAADHVRENGLVTASGDKSPVVTILENAEQRVSTLATALRLTPSSRMDRKVAGATTRGDGPVVVDFSKLRGGR